MGEYDRVVRKNTDDNGDGDGDSRKEGMNEYMYSILMHQ